MMLGGEEDARSECSSGCQSGWTMYLDQSSSFETLSSLNYKKGGSFPLEEANRVEEEEEEDLSMVSDASSGPPHFHGGGQQCDSCRVSGACRRGCWSLSSAMAPAAAVLPVEGGKKRRVESGQRVESSSILDDTASSPLLNCSQSSFNGDMNGNYRLKTSIEVDDALEFSCNFSATRFEGKSAMLERMGQLGSSVPMKPNPTRPVSRTDSGRKMR